MPVAFITIQKKILNAITRTVQRQQMLLHLPNLKRMENLLEKLTNQMAALIDHTQNVAGNTELTAQRIM